MPETTSPFGITTPCITESISLASFLTYANDTEEAIATVDALGQVALVRPAAVVRSAAGNAYTAGVALVPAFDTIIANIGGLFTLAAPTIFTVTTPGLYMISVESQANTLGTNTSHRGEILVNGLPVSSVETGPGVGGGLPPPTSITSTAFAQMAPGFTISMRVTVAGVGNSNAFPRMGAALVTFGGV